MSFCKQDMPPPGGYNPISFKKVPIKTMNAYGKLAFFFVFTATGWIAHKQCQKEKLMKDIQLRCGKVALFPMLLAEKDRAQLKYLKYLRDQEEKVMKNVEGWEVGKYKGDPVFFTIPPNGFYHPNLTEIFAHTESTYEEELLHGQNLMV